MNSKLNKTLAYTAIFSLIFLAQAAYAQPAGEGRRAEGAGAEYVEPSSEEGTAGGPEAGTGGALFRGKHMERFKAPASEGGKIQGPAREKAFDKIVQELGLTVEQQKLIKEQRAERRRKMLDANQELRNKRMQLKQELEKKDVDKGKIQNLVNEIKSLQGQQLELRVADTLAMKEIFTPEQYEKFQGLTKCGSRQGRFMGKMGGNCKTDSSGEALD